MDDHTHHEIKEVNDYSTFYNVYKTYTYPPYNEDWSDSEIEQEYQNIKQRGVLYGFYVDGKCIGILALRIKDQPLQFDNNTKSIYLSDKAELSEWPDGFFNQTQKDFARLFNLRRNG